MLSISRKTLLLSELTLFMIGVPLVLVYLLPPYGILPVVWGMALFCSAVAKKVEKRRFREYWHYAGVTRRELLLVATRFVICAVLLGWVTYTFQPQMLFSLWHRSHGFWLLVMVLYPVLSVVPQEIIFRRYLFTRFEGMMSPTALWLVSGLGFGFAHIVFRNWVAPLLCAIGGLMFAQTYKRTRSLALVSLEHALYGDFVFTIGLGHYFFHGAVGMR
jgi:membrane protease YdiL (CAAX protease family)